MKMRFFTCLTLGMLALQAHSAEPRTAEPTKPKSTSISAKEYSVDLMQLYNESRLEDPRVLAAYARSQAGEEHKKEAFGSLLPQISANAGGNRIKNGLHIAATTRCKNGKADRHQTIRRRSPSR